MPAQSRPQCNDCIFIEPIPKVQRLAACIPARWLWLASSLCICLICLELAVGADSSLILACLAIAALAFPVIDLIASHARMASRRELDVVMEHSMMSELFFESVKWEFRRQHETGWRRAHVQSIYIALEHMRARRIEANKKEQECQRQTQRKSYQA